MSQTLVDVAELPARLDEVLQLAAAGAEVIVTDQTGPRARLLPVQIPAGGRIPGLHAGKIQASADFDEPLPESFWTGSP